MSSNKKRILIAEDEGFARKAIVLSLEANGYEPLEAVDGQEAWEILQDQHESIDMLITDIKMPRMDGQTLLKKIREEAMTLPVICISAFGNKEVVLDLLRHGCQNYLDKPVEEDDIINTIKSVFENIGSDQEKLDVYLENPDVKNDADIEIIEKGNLSLIHPKKDLIHSTASQFCLLLGEQVSRGCLKFSFNLRDVLEIDSSALAAFLTLSKKTSEGQANLSMAGVSEDLQILFHATRLDRHYQIEGKTV